MAYLRKRMSGVSPAVKLRVRRTPSSPTTEFAAIGFDGDVVQVSASADAAEERHPTGLTGLFKIGAQI